MFTHFYRKIELFHFRKQQLMYEFVFLQNGSAIFGAPLNIVPQQNIKCCGQLVQIPALVHQLCTALKSNLSVEGLFRKAGSQMRQKEMKVYSMKI